MLEGEQKEKYKALSTELSNLQVRFSQNTTNDMKSPNRRLWLTVDQLEGLPQNVIEMARMEAKTALEGQIK